MGGIKKQPSFAFLEEKKAEEVFGSIPTPCYVIEEAALERNGKILGGVIERTGCKILLAQKAFSNYNFYPLLAPYLSGTEASGLYEARLGAEEMGEKEVHVFCGAYREEEFEELLDYADHLVFNSPNQLKQFGKRAKERGKSIGLRINPECSTQEGHEIYDPCGKGSRLGTTKAVWEAEMSKEWIDLLDGLHFHTLCEQGAEDLEITLQAVEEKFGWILPQMKWLNMGGGHHITKSGYRLDLLERCIRYAQKTWEVEVYLEPGEAVALDAGYLVTRVLDVISNGEEKIAILDASAACHMPDVIEMPYMPPLYEADREWFEGAKAYRLGGPTCLAGDVIGTYYVQKELRQKDCLILGDMAIYTTCKNNTFNGMPLPAIWRRTLTGELEQVKGFGYEDFKQRLGG